jgi:hypothetical protein
MNLKVEKDEITSITVKAPTNTKILKNEDLKLDGGIITLNHLNGTKEDIDMTDAASMKDVRITGFDKTKTGKQTVTVTYKDKYSATFEVEVTDKPAKSMVVKSEPTKKLYKVGEDFEVDGLTLEVTYEDGTKETIDATADMVYGYDNTRVGEQTLTIAYQKLTTTIKVEVEENKTWKFIDVPEQPGNWIYEAAKFVSENGYMTGMDTAGTIFNPAGILSRGQFATIIYRLAGEPAASYSHVFPDVYASDWYAIPAVWANSKKIITGYADGFFGAGDDITREQMALIMYRFAKEYGFFTGNKAALSAYTDAADVSYWATEAMQWAVGNKIITGKTATTLDPAGKASRAECATIIMRFADMIGQA